MHINKDSSPAAVSWAASKRRGTCLMMTVSMLFVSTAMATASTTDSKVICNAVPHNNLSIPAQEFSLLTNLISRTSRTVGSGVGSVGGLSEVQFHALIAKIQQYYQDTFDQKGSRLSIRSFWDSPRVQATATLDDDDSPVINVHGGLARHPLMTPDAFVGFLCHELGHFLGGAPKIPRGSSGRLSWSSAEGQADYFAANKCLKALFVNSTENDFMVSQLGPQERNDLSVRCLDSQCMRIVMAGKLMSKIIADVTGKSMNVAVANPDPTRVSATLYQHPSPQCRLDTMVAGANCPVGPNQPFDDRDPNVGACIETEHADARRPECWFNSSRL